MREAQNVGVEYIDEIQLNSVVESEHELTLHGTGSLKQLTVRARFVVDATGPHGFLHRALNLPEIPLPEFPVTQALYSHFSGVTRFGEEIHLRGERPPYPVEDAAVHHIFDGGWVWVLHFNNGITSAGAAMTDALGDRLRLQDGEPGWQRLLHLLPPCKVNLPMRLWNVPSPMYRGFPSEAARLPGNDGCSCLLLPDLSTRSFPRDLRSPF